MREERGTSESTFSLLVTEGSNAEDSYGEKEVTGRQRSEGQKMRGGVRV